METYVPPAWMEQLINAGAWSSVASDKGVEMKVRRWQAAFGALALAVMLASCSDGSEPQTPVVTATMPELPPGSRISSVPLTVLSALEDPEGQGYSYARNEVRGPTADGVLATISWAIESEQPDVGQGAGLAVYATQEDARAGLAALQIGARICSDREPTPLPELADDVTVMFCPAFDPPLAFGAFVVDEVVVSFRVTAGDAAAARELTLEVADDLRAVAVTVVDRLTA